MGEKTKIQWTDATWNPVRGCSRVSGGCRKCYAEKIAARFSDEGQPFHLFADPNKSGSKWTGKVALIEDALTIPLHWRKPRRVFVNSMSDLFHENLPDEAIDRVFAVMALCPQHTFQVLTKRPERMLGYLSKRFGAGHRGDVINGQISRWLQFPTDFPVGRSFSRYCEAWPLPNVWLGVSVENQKTANERIPLLLQTPAAVRFVSYEPALGPVDVERYLECLGQEFCQNCGDAERVQLTASEIEWTKRGDGVCSECGQLRSATGYDPRDGQFRKLDWVICGGESGPGARPFDIAWARNVVARCKAASVPCFVKQLGADPREGNTNGNCRDVDCTHPDCGYIQLNLKDHKGGDMSEWPEDLQVREYPT